MVIPCKGAFDQPPSASRVLANPQDLQAIMEPKSVTQELRVIGIVSKPPVSTDGEGGREVRACCRGLAS